MSSQVAIECGNLGVMLQDFSGQRLRGCFRTGMPLDIFQLGGPERVRDLSEVIH
jgi:hypothetical protein